MQSFIRNAVNGAEGEGASVDRLFPVQGLMNFDPFVLWDDFTISAGAGFPDHPHRGFEGITYVFQGSVLMKLILNVFVCNDFVVGMHDALKSPDRST